MARQFLGLSVTGAAAIAATIVFATPPSDAGMVVPGGLDPAAICRGGAMAAARGPAALRPGFTTVATDAADDLDLMEKLGLLEGHLMIGRDLLAAGRARDALPHFGHPVRELYDYLEPFVARTGVKPFDGELKQLEALAKDGAPAAAFAAQYDRALAGVTALRATVPAARLADRGFVFQFLALMVEDVASDYGESLDKGRHVNTVEYHDSLGFLRYTIRTVEELRGSGDAALWGRVRTELAQVETAYPALMPPAKPVRSVAFINGVGARIAKLGSGV